MGKKINLKEKYRKFKAWQLKPREIAPNSQEEHECLNCHDHYTGKFCPRCGQPATTDRFSMKVAVENFVDAYGMGERGMFRTIRDLILRPGYLILDYLRGMRVSNYAPFKMFFLLTAISLLVTHGFNIKGKILANDDESESSVQVTQDESEGTDNSSTVTMEGSQTDEELESLSDRTATIVNGVIDKIDSFHKRSPSILMLLLLLFISGHLYIFFRHSPNIPDLRYSEFLVSMVYITNMYTIYSIVFDFFCLELLSSYSILLTLIPLTQLSGYSWWRTTLKAVVSAATMFTLAVLLLVLAVFIIAMYVKKFG